MVPLCHCLAMSDLYLFCPLHLSFFSAVSVHYSNNQKKTELKKNPLA